MKELAPIIENEKDGQFMVLIPAGDFIMGSDKRKDNRGSDHEMPQHRHGLDAFYMGLYAVTNLQYARFLNEMKPTKGDLEKWILFDSDCFVRRKATGGFEAYGGKEYHPVVQVSWYGAGAYCEWAGLALPTEAQWEKGARGTDGRIHPWGDAWDQSRCRNDKNRGSERTCRVWEYPSGVSPYGLFNMAGNVWEWCEEWYDSVAYRRYAKGDYALPQSGRSRVLRGGSWSRDSDNYFRCAYRFNYYPVSRSSFSGFRCARTRF